MRHPLRISITSSLETCSWKTFVARPDQTNINDFICAGAPPSINPSYLNLTTYLIKSSQTQTQRRRVRNAPKPNISKQSVPERGRMFGGALKPLIGEGAARNEKGSAITKWITHTHNDTTTDKHTHTHTHRALPRLTDQYLEVKPHWPHLKFKGWGERPTCEV